MDNPINQGVVRRTPINFDPSYVGNWQRPRRLVMTVRPDAPLHERLAWCWGLANDLHQLMLVVSNDTTFDGKVGVAALYNQMCPLVAMLQHVAGETVRVE